jgi:hypothetical protein
VGGAAAGPHELAHASASAIEIQRTPE